MKVYYGQNFWGDGEDGTEMEEIQLNKAFLWEDIEGVIASVYVSEEGIVLDFCIRVSNDKVQNFYNKWQHKLGAPFAEEEAEQLAKENPLNQVDFNLEVSVNGVLLKNEFGCGASYTRLFENNMKNSLEEQIFSAYHCDENSSWHFKRHVCSWPQRPQKLEEITIDFLAYDKRLECGKLEIGIADAKKEYDLIHPSSGAHYVLCVDKVEQHKLSDLLVEVPEYFRYQEFPSHYLQVTYHMQPDILSSAFLLRCAQKGDKPRRYMTGQAANVAVIGGADGPTSIFIAGKMDEKQGRVAVSDGLFFEPIERSYWIPTFIVKERQNMTLSIKLV